MALPFLACEVYSQNVDYLRDVKPLLSEKCVACHGGLKQESDLRLDHGSFIEAGSVVVAGKPEESELFSRVSTEDESLHMPPLEEGAALEEEQIALVREWIELGAQLPNDEPLPIDPSKHWAWKTPSASAVPEVDAEWYGSWAVNPIDAFIAEQLEKTGIVPNAIASPRTLVRRMYFDLIGLPPPPETLQSFEDDPSAENWHALVDRLLDDPAHGERWARHWMDVWRYSDWDGYKNQLRGSQRHIWRWRDWIVDSLNEDKGYDQMILEMLAGDEIAGEDPNIVRATGFLARNYHKSNRNIWLDATVEHTSKAFLGLTINCARCHDHKYDPISQQEYYALRAIFEPHNVRTERVPGQRNTLLDGLVRAYDAKLEEPTYLYQGGNEKLPDKTNPIRPGVPAAVQLAYEASPVQHSKLAALPDLNEFVEREDLAAATKKIKSIEAKLAKLDTLSPEATETEKLVRLSEEQKLVQAKADLQSLHARWAADKCRHEGTASAGKPESETTFRALKTAAVNEERKARVESQKLAWLTKKIEQSKLIADKNSTESARKNAKTEVDKAKKELVKAEKALAEVTDEDLSEEQLNKLKYTEVVKTYPAQSTGRRLALAKWIANRKNPLTARVAVNYLWLHHFGEPLVENVFDFGLRSPEPVHRKLLDWLAVELMNNDWSMKHIHRLMVSSRTYQSSSRYSTEGTRVAEKHDPDNRLFWRANVRRLGAEVVRDSLLKVGNSLNTKLGGPEIDFTEGEKVARKSLYFRTAYEKQMTMLVIFDAAAPNECYRRTESIIPQQALALANSPLATDQSRRLAKQLWTSELDIADKTKDQTRIREAFEIVLGRPCTEDELQACEEFLKAQSQLLRTPAKLTKSENVVKAQFKPASQAALRARENLIHSLINHNDFVTVR